MKCVIMMSILIGFSVHAGRDACQQIMLQKFVAGQDVLPLALLKYHKKKHCDIIYSPLYQIVFEKHDVRRIVLSNEQVKKYFTRALRRLTFMEERRIACPPVQGMWKFELSDGVHEHFYYSLCYLLKDCCLWGQAGDESKQLLKKLIASLLDRGVDARIFFSRTRIYGRCITSAEFENYYSHQDGVVFKEIFEQALDEFAMRYTKNINFNKLRLQALCGVKFTFQ